MSRILLLALAALACRPTAVKTPEPPCPPAASDLSSESDAIAGVEPRFTVVVLGTQGGLVSDDLSSYLVATLGTRHFVCLDAGTLYTGLQRADERGAFAHLDPEDDPTSPRFMLPYIHAYLISHPHLDHVAGLVLASPADGADETITGAKPTIAGLAPTLAALRDHLFNNVVWANFGDGGREPRLGRFHLRELAPTQPIPLEHTNMTVEAWPLSHAGTVSTAFLLREYGGAALLYLGDTGPDAVEREGRLAALWQRVAPLVREGALRAIFLEVSYPDPRPDDQLYGHLTPKWLDAELRALAAAVDPNDPAALRRVKVVVTHIKPASLGPDARQTIMSQLASVGAGARLIFPSQGDRLSL